MPTKTTNLSPGYRVRISANAERKKAHWINMGRIFGYRECCIEYFCNFFPAPAGWTLRNQGREHQIVPGGPILCEACGDQRRTGRFSLQEYFVNRMVPYPCSKRTVREILDGFSTEGTKTGRTSCAQENLSNGSK